MKISVEVLNERAEATVSVDLLASIPRDHKYDYQTTPVTIAENLPAAIKNVQDTAVLVPKPGRLHD